MPFGSGGQELRIDLVADISQFAAAMSSGGQALLLFAGAVEQAAASSISFTTELTQIQNNTNMTDAATQAMGQSIKAVAAESNVSLEQLGDGYMHIANFSFQGAAATDILTEAMKSASSTGGNTAATANLLANAMHEYGNETYSARQAVDILHVAAQRGNATFEQFAESSGRAVGVAANLHVPLEQVTAAMSALTQHGYDAAEAQTQIVAAMTHIIHPSSAAAAEFDNLAKQTGHEELAAKNLLNTLSTTGLTGVITSLQDAYKKMGFSETEATGETLKLVNAQRGGLGMASLLGTANADYNQTLTAMDAALKGAGPTEEAFARSTHTAGYELEVAANNAKLFGLNVGDYIVTKVQEAGGWLDAWGVQLHNIGSELAYLTATKQQQAYADEVWAAADFTAQQQQERLAERADSVATAISRANLNRANSATLAAAAQKQSVAEEIAALNGLDSDTAKAVGSMIGSLGKMADATKSGSRDSAAATAEMAALMRTDWSTLPPEFGKVRDTMLTDMQSMRDGGTMTVAQMNAQIVGLLQALTHSTDVETAAMAQAALDHFDDLHVKATTVAGYIGADFIGALTDQIAGGMPGFRDLLSGILQTADQSEKMGLIGGAMGRKFRIEMLAEMSQAMSVAAARLNEALEGADNSATVHMRAMAQHYSEAAIALAKDEGMIGDHIGKTIEAVNTEAAAAEHAAVRHAAAGASKAAAAERHEAAVAKAAATAARQQAISADAMIKDLGKAELATVDGTQTIAQAYEKLVPILTAKLPDSMKWLQTDYTDLLAQLTSATPPSLDEISRDFQAWNERLRNSQNGAWRLMAQANKDAYITAAADWQTHLQDLADKQARADADAEKKRQDEIHKAQADAAALVKAQESVLGGLAQIVQTAAQPAYNLGALMSQTADLMAAATEAKMPDLVSRLQGYFDQMRAGQQIDTAAMDADFGLMLDTMAQQGTPKEQAIAQSFHDMWEQVRKDAATEQQKIRDEAQSANSALVSALGGAGTAQAGGTAGIPAQVTAALDAAKAAAKAGMTDLGAELTKDATAALAGVPGAFDAMIVAERVALERLAQSVDPVIAAAARTALAQVAADAEQFSKQMEAVYQKQEDDAKAAAQKTAQAAQSLATGLSTVGQAILAEKDNTRQAEIALGQLAEAARAAGPAFAPLVAQIEAALRSGASLSDMLRMISDAEAQLAASADPMTAALARQAQAELAQAAAVAQATAALKALQAAQVADQAAVTAATKAVQDQQAAVSDLQKQYGDAQTALNNFKSAQLQGTEAAGDKGFAVGQQQKAVQLVIDDLAAAGGDTAKARATLTGQIATLRAEHLRNEGALAAQIAATGDTAQRANLQKQLDAMRASDQATETSLSTALKNLGTGDSKTALDSLNAQLKALQTTGAQLAGLDALTFDPMKKAIDGAASSVKELSFAAIIKGVSDSKTQMNLLGPAIAGANKHLAALQEAEAAAQVVLAAATAAVQTQQAAIATLQNTTDAAVAGMNTSMVTGLGDIAASVAAQADPSASDSIMGAFAGGDGLLIKMQQAMGGIPGITGSAASFWPNMRTAWESLFATGIPEAIDSNTPAILKDFKQFGAEMISEAKHMVNEINAAFAGIRWPAPPSAGGTAGAPPPGGNQSQMAGMAAFATMPAPAGGPITFSGPIILRLPNGALVPLPGASLDGGALRFTMASMGKRVQGAD